MSTTNPQTDKYKSKAVGKNPLAYNITGINILEERIPQENVSDVCGSLSNSNNFKKSTPVQAHPVQQGYYFMWCTPKSCSGAHHQTLEDCFKCAGNEDLQAAWEGKWLSTSTWQPKVVLSISRAHTTQFPPADP